jgi:signal transduction histidine kinase
MIPLVIIIAAVTFAVGLAVYWSNPSRLLNRTFAFGSVMVTVWLLLVQKAQSAGNNFPESNPVPWLRANATIAAFFPLVIWLLQDSVTTGAVRIKQTLVRASPWIAFGIMLAAVSQSELFIPSSSTPKNELHGPGFAFYFGISGIAYLLLLALCYAKTRRHTGIRKIELQFLTVNGAISGFASVALTVAGNFLDYRFLSRLSPLFILVFYGLTAWAVTIHRVFDARQVFLSVTQRVGMIAFLATGINLGTFLLAPILQPPGNLILSVVAFSTLAFWLDRHSRGWLNLNVWQNTIAIRQAALELARREPDPNKLVTEFEALLRGWCQTNYAALLFDSGEVYVSTNIEFAKDRTGFRALCKQGWSTPESLQRLRPEPGLIDLRQFFTEFNLGLTVTAPRGSPTPSLLLSLGVKTNFRPFTYPEVQQLQEVAEFMDNILARSRLSMQARQSEQLATIGLIGASLAHEIRNPLVSIKTFSHLLASRFDDPEFRRRFSTLIPAEVERIDSLTQQLLDLSHPRRHQMERISLHKVIQETTDLMLARSQEAQVNLVIQQNATADTIYADGGAIRQVAINLIINALQALEGQEGERNITIRSRNSPNGSVILEVSDNGPGIPPDQRARLFHPFVSTKTKGMGLGLAVCADILHEHKATIIVPDIGRPGATFRITFPCPPPSS